MWLWVNTHGSFPLGLAALGLLLVGRWLDRGDARAEARAFGWAVAGTLLAAVNPLGPKLLVFPLGLLSNREAFGAIAEWKAPTWHTAGEWLFAVELAVAVLACLARGRRWRVALPLVVFGAMGLMSVRNVAPTSLVLLPGLAVCLRGVGSLDGTGRPRVLRPVLAVLVALAVVVPVISLVSSPDTDLEAYPEQAVDVDARQRSARCGRSGGEPGLRRQLPGRPASGPTRSGCSSTTGSTCSPSR